MKATYIIAVLCGASRIVPETKYVCLKIDGAVKMGVSTYPSSGINPDTMKNICITPGFQRDLLIMNMLDIICRQQDHRPNNYFCILDEAGMQFSAMTQFSQSLNRVVNGLNSSLFSCRGYTLG